MTSILKSDNTKNGIIIKESGKKFEEATSTSGCDLEMSEITSSMPHSLSLSHLDTFTTNVVNNEQIINVVNIAEENITYVKIKVQDSSSHLEDVVDGFSIFSFETEDDLIKFSIKTEKIETLSESENSKFKKIAKVKKQNKFIKANKEPLYNEDGIDIYDFQANSESSPSSKNSNFNFKKSLSKKFTTKYCKKFKHKFKTENNLSPSEENSSNTSVTECHNNLLCVDGRNESPRPTSNDDNNVVSTTTPDNVNIEMEKLEIQAGNIISPLKTASLRLYKLEDELTISSNNLNPTVVLEIPTDVTNDLQFPQHYSGSNTEKIYNNQSQSSCNDEKFQSKNIPTKFSVDLLTKITEKQSIVDDSNKCLTNSNINIDWNLSKKSPDQESNHSTHTSNSSNKITVFDTAVVTGDSQHINNKMTSALVKQLIGNNCCSSASFRDGSMSSNGSCHDGRALTSNDNPSTNEEDCNNEKNISKSSTNSPMQSWLELHTKGILQHQYNLSSHSTIQANSNATIMPTKSASSTSFNPLNSSSHSSHSAHNHKSQHDATLIDWKNNYFDSSKLLANSLPKFNQNLSSLSHELANNIRYQQEQQELMNALCLKHENSKIPKPLVHMGLDSMYKVDQSLYKNPESRFQTPNVHNCFLPNSQMPVEFNTANVFKTRSDPRCHQNSLEGATNKDSFSKALPTNSSNFKTPETVKRRGQWCDMHVKIAYFIYRSQRRMSMMKSQDMNTQLSHLMYSQKIPPTGSVPTPSPYPSNFLQHSSPYIDYRSSQIKPDSGYLNYHPKSSNAFLNTPIRSMNPYHSIIPQSIDVDLLPPSTAYEDHNQTPEQKWLRLLSQYMNNHPLSSVERPNPEILNQLYLWYQQLAQSNNAMPHFNAQAPSVNPLHSSNLDSNSAYLRKYMEHLTSCKGSMKGDTSSYSNNSMNEREFQLYLMKQQQYQKTLMSKYQAAAINKPNTLNHINPLMINSSNTFYNKKIMEMKGVSNEGLLPQYPEYIPSLANSKYRLMQDQIRQMKQESFANHYSRNSYAKLSDQINPKRRKLNNESLKTDIIQNGGEREDCKSVTDLTGDFISITGVSNNASNNITQEKSSSKSRDNINFHLQTVVPDNKE